MTIQNMMADIGQNAKRSTLVLARASGTTVNAVLQTLADLLRQNTSQILQANAQDIAQGKAKGLTSAMLDRLLLTPERIDSMAQGVEGVKAQPDPVERILWETRRPNGLYIQRVAVPIGVLGMIYESRPNVTIDAAALCLKSRNAVILRGGSESLQSSLALHALIEQAFENHSLPKFCVCMIPTSDREAVGAMLGASDYIDVMIPRGGKNLIERVMREAKMPVFGHLEGLCHIYIHHDVDLKMACEVTYNAKLRRTGVYGAMETLLLDRALDHNTARAVLSGLIEGGCEIVGDERARALDPRIGIAAPEDWSTEYLEAKLSCGVVDGLDQAISHINHYGSHHTDSILTHSPEVAERFLKDVDSGIVLHNASTQFADGGEFGMGAEIGIATGKMHARGPVGVEQLCTYKYLVRGTGQTRP